MSNADRAPVLGVFVFEESWRSWDRRQMMEACSVLADCGINRFMTETWYPEEALIEAVHQRGMGFWVSVPCFSDHAEPIRPDRPELTPIDPSGAAREQQEWYVGLVPTDAGYNEELLARCTRIASSFEIEGVALDFMRWPLHWELELRPGSDPVDSSFDAGSLASFRSFNPGFPEGLTGADAAGWILNRDLETWIEFKCRVITELAARIAGSVRTERPGLGTGIFIGPGDEVARRRYMGQDVASLGNAVDELFPMAYHRILHRPTAWIREIVGDVRARVDGASTIPVVQVSSDEAFAGPWDWGEAMNDGEAGRALEAGLEGGAGGGVVAFPGEALLVTGRGGELREAFRYLGAGTTGG